MRDIGPTELFLVLIALAVFLTPAIWWLVCLVQAVRVPEPQWVAAGQSKVVTILLMVLLGVVGTIVYAVAVRPALRRIAPV